jgi:tRNA (guanine37-N1)-methyltransferase
VEVDKSTWSSTLQKLVSNQKVGLVPYSLHLGYDYWSYHDIISSILPEELLDELPTGFQTVGHVAHFNLRDKFLPYKHLLASIILDKYKGSLRTVINKVDSVGTEDRIFRTFAYEVLAGPDDLMVTVREQDCNFVFDYAKVYWNSKLSTEHERIVTQKFKPGEAVCDVMAGIGPFAIPAGKHGVFVWANDLNPQSAKYLKEGVQRNKVDKWVECFNGDGNEFIKMATKELWTDGDYSIDIQVPVAGQATTNEKGEIKKLRKATKSVARPRVFSHFVMNLPASAITFLPAFIGLYAGAEIPHDQPLPKVHVYCFAPKSDDVEEISQNVCDKVSAQLNYKFKIGQDDVEGEVNVFDVRDISPKKRMFCASFTLPQEVAYRETKTTEQKGSS